MFVFIFVSCILILMLYIAKKPRNLPPGPTGTIPFLGNLSIYTKLMKKADSLVIEEFRNLYKKYGEIFQFQVGYKPMIFVCGMDALKEIFIKQGDITSDRPSSLITTIGEGIGLTGSSGHIWREQRAFASKTLRHFGLGKKSLEIQIKEEVETLLPLIEEKNGEPFNIESLLSISIANVVSRLTFGKVFEHNDENGHRLMNLITRGYENEKIYLLDYFPFLKYLPGDIFGINRITKNLKEVLSFLENIVHEHRESLDADNPRDYVDEFLLAQKNQSDNPDSTFSDQQLIMTIRNFFIAGTETTSSTIRWAILFLIHNPEIQTKMREEIKRVIGPSQMPSYQQKSTLPYCQAFISETQRLGNVSFLSLPHVSTKEFTYKEYTIPKGATMYVLIDALSSDPKIFPKPEVFDPERFISEKGEFYGQERIIPFSIGRRNCIGESLARMELFFFIVTLVQRFEFKAEDEMSLPSRDGVFGVGYSPKPFRFRAIKIT